MVKRLHSPYIYYIALWHGKVLQVACQKIMYCLMAIDFDMFIVVINSLITEILKMS